MIIMSHDVKNGQTFISKIEIIIVLLKNVVDTEQKQNKFKFHNIQNLDLVFPIFNKESNIFKNQKNLFLVKTSFEIFNLNKNKSSSILMVIKMKKHL